MAEDENAFSENWGRDDTMVINDAHEVSGAIVADARVEAKRILSNARSTADTVRVDAESRAAQMMKDAVLAAELRASQLLEDAKAVAAKTIEAAASEAFYQTPLAIEQQFASREEQERLERIVWVRLFQVHLAFVDKTLQEILADVRAQNGGHYVVESPTKRMVKLQGPSDYLMHQVLGKVKRREHLCMEQLVLAKRALEEAKALTAVAEGLLSG